MTNLPDKKEQSSAEALQREEDREKKDVLRVTFVFSEEDWTALGFSKKPGSLEIKQAVYNLIHTMTPEELPLVMGTKTVAKVLNMNQQTVKLWAQHGVIPASKISGRWRFRRNDVLDFMEQYNGKARQAQKLKEEEEERQKLREELKEIRRQRETRETNE